LHRAQWLLLQCDFFKGPLCRAPQSAFYLFCVLEFRMKVLVIGGGGREHAMAWKLAQSQKVQMVYVAPGNGGTAMDSRLQNIPITDVVALREWAQENKIGLTLVGPEGPLALGVVDEFRQHGLRIFGPTKAAAQLESSKAFSKAFMRRHGIPTAEYATFSDPVTAHTYVNQMGAPIVIKADGLAAGKGVVVAMTLDEAHAAIDFMLLDNALGVIHNDNDDGRAVPRVVIEEFLEGEEASFMVLCDGKSVVPLATSQDHKRLLDGDAGPNTGGMGAYSPAPVVTPQVHAKAMREIILPTIKGMEKDGIPFTGFLYAGLMIDSAGQVKTLEFNCRMGDPETQPILMRLKTDFLDVLLAATETAPENNFAQLELDWDRRTALGVVVAAGGYPMTPVKGALVTGLPKEAEDAVVFHAGTTTTPEGVAVSGGRVLCVTALADGVKQAQTRAYQALQGISFDGMQFRSDIGYRAIKGQ
jgi:phosphoribosylamine--glycine ligase